MNLLNICLILEVMAIKMESNNQFILYFINNYINNNIYLI